MRPERLELPTACSEDKCSVQLSYGRSFRQGVIIVYFRNGRCRSNISECLENGLNFPFPQTLHRSMFEPRRGAQVLSIRQSLVSQITDLKKPKLMIGFLERLIEASLYDRVFPQFP